MINLSLRLGRRYRFTMPTKSPFKAADKARRDELGRRRGKGWEILENTKIIMV
jgi:hypothetical protein